MLSIHVSTKTVESFYLYVDADEFIKTDHKDRLPTDDHVFIDIRMKMSKGIDIFIKDDVSRNIDSPFPNI